MISHDELLARVRYEPSTGLFHSIKKNRPIGSFDSDGYVKITLTPKYSYTAHRLAVFYMTKKWPSGVVDHINRIRYDNRWENLRDVSQADNNRNREIVPKWVGRDIYFFHKKSPAEMMRNLLCDDSARRPCIDKTFQASSKDVFINPSKEIIQNEDIIHMAKKPAKTAASKVKSNGEEKVLRSRGKRKLNNDQVFAIVKAYAAPGVTMKMVASEFGISVGTVQAIVSGKTYKWLTGIGVGVLATKKTRGKVAPVAAPAEIGAEAAFA